MKAIPARPIGPPIASTSWLPAGPTTATMLEFEMNSWVTVVACAGFSCVSPWTRVIFVLLAALSIDTASSAKCNCSVPSGATGPVIGPSNPTDATHVLAAADALVVPPLAAVLLLLLLLQPATASEPTAAAARTRRPFMGYASISRTISRCSRCRSRDARAARGRRNAGRSAACGVVRLGAAFEHAQYALPNGRIRSDDQTIAV